MIKIDYEEYYSDSNRMFKKVEFKSLKELADWIFENVRNGYSDKSRGRYLLWFPTPQKMERIKNDGPARIEFRPLNSSSYIWIHMITNGKRIIFSDGKLTEGRTYWNQAVRKWLEECEYRQYHPGFVFYDSETGEAEPFAIAELVEEAVKKGVLTCASVEPEGRVAKLVRGLTHEKAVSRDMIWKIAQDLSYEAESRNMIRKELRKKSAEPAKQPDTGTEPPKGAGANRIQVPLTGGEMLSIYQNADPGFPHEVFVEVIGADGKWQQDIACIRNETNWGKDGSLHVLKDRYEVLVWGDGESEDYTEKIPIKKASNTEKH